MNFLKNILITTLAVAIYGGLTTLMIYYNQEKLSDLELEENDFKKSEAPVFKKNKTENAQTIDLGSNELVSELRDENEQLQNDVEKLKENVASLQGELDTLLKPMEEDILSSTLKASVGNEEVLVTGGSLTPDGKYQYAFVEPVTEQLPDGSTAIHLKTKQLSISPEIIPDLGLESLVTNAGNTLQHGEIWSVQELEDINSMLGRDEGVVLLTSPQITVIPGKKTDLEVGDYQISTRADILPDGSGFDIELRMEQPRFSEDLITVK